jgi:hypothetical protein
MPFSVAFNKEVHIDAANRDIKCYLIENGLGTDAKK